MTTPETIFRNLATTITRECNKFEPDWKTLIHVTRQTMDLVEPELCRPERTEAPAKTEAAA